MQDTAGRWRRSGRLALLVAALGSCVGGCRAVAPSDDADRLVSERWVLVAIESPEGELLPDPAHRPSLVFHLPAPDDEEALARVSGDGGCNRFWGRYQLLSRGELAFSAIASTRMACAHERLVVEQLLFEVLSGPARYEVVDSVLTLHAANTILHFRAAGQEAAETGAG